LKPPERRIQAGRDILGWLVVRGRYANLAQLPDRQAGCMVVAEVGANGHAKRDRKSTRLNSSHVKISYAVFCLKKKNAKRTRHQPQKRPLSMIIKVSRGSTARTILDAVKRPPQNVRLQNTGSHCESTPPDRR